jgi:Bacterial type II and III secretion system protein
MKKMILALSLAMVALAAPRLLAQEKEKPSSEAKPTQIEKALTPLRVQVVFTEFDGEKKVSSLPYTFLVTADYRGERAAVRMGLRVPIETSSNTGVKQISYQDIGTNLDGRAERLEDGRFSLMLTIEKSSAYLSGANEKLASMGGNEISNAQPTIQQFRTQVNLQIRDGQTVQSTVATDPVTGHVTKVDVTLNVIK